MSKIDILQHIGLVRWVLQKDFAWALKCGVGEDLFQQGLVGLLKAAAKFKKKKGRKFSPYAVWYIKMYVRQGIRLYGLDKKVKIQPPVIVPLDDKILDERRKEEDAVKKKVMFFLCGMSGSVREEDIWLIKERFGIDMPKKTVKELSEQYGCSAYAMSHRIKKILGRLKKLI